MLNLPCRDLQAARYPIRRKDDLLPLFRLGTRESLALLTEELRQAGCGMSEALALDHVVGRQLSRHNFLGGCISPSRLLALRFGRNHAFYDTPTSPIVSTRLSPGIA